MAAISARPSATSNIGDDHANMPATPITKIATILA